jgi:MarR-like DNA-binding transcriptional regulator SgrR of sgrS sRNA
MILYQFVVEDDLICLFELLKMSNSYVRAHLNPELAKIVDVGIEELWAIPDEAERLSRFTRLIEELQRHKAFLFMLHKTWRTAYPGSVKGVVFNSFGWIDFKQAWFTHRSNSNAADQAVTAKRGG